MTIFIEAYNEFNKKLLKKKREIGTVTEIWSQKDRQTNLDPASRWIDSTTETITTDHFEEIGHKKIFKVNIGVE